MNVIFHTATAVATVVLIADCKSKVSSISYMSRCFLSLATGIIFHSILDYVPHCYPLNSKLDVIISSIIMIFLFWRTPKQYKIILAAAFIGNILPDIIDLLPGILNKLFNLKIKIIAKIFPWHWSLYSGSIYSGSCNVSNLNHLMIVALVCVICWCRKKQFKAIFISQKNPF
jgi:hypothetical protein